MQTLGPRKGNRRGYFVLVLVYKKEQSLLEVCVNKHKIISQPNKGVNLVWKEIKVECGKNCSQIVYALHTKYSV